MIPVTTTVIFRNSEIQWYYHLSPQKKQDQKFKPTSLSSPECNFVREISDPDEQDEWYLEVKWSIYIRKCGLVGIPNSFLALSWGNEFWGYPLSSTVMHYAWLQGQGARTWNQSVWVLVPALPECGASNIGLLTSLLWCLLFVITNISW